MKTITTLLMSCFLLVGGFNPVMARDDARQEKKHSQRNEITYRSESKPERNREIRIHTNEVRKDRQYRNEYRTKVRYESRMNERRPYYNHVNIRLQERPLNLTLEDLAWQETNRMAYSLDLSQRQRNRIFEINFRYMTHHYNGQYYPASRRDREIRSILRMSQLVAFAILLKELYDVNTAYNYAEDEY